MTLPLNFGKFGLNFFIILVKQHFCVHWNFMDVNKKLHRLEEVRIDLVQT